MGGFGSHCELWRARDKEHIEALHVVQRLRLVQLDFGAVEEVNMAALDGSYGRAETDSEQVAHM